MQIAAHDTSAKGLTKIEHTIAIARAIANVKIGCFAQ